MTSLYQGNQQGSIPDGKQGVKQDSQQVATPAGKQRSGHEGENFVLVDSEQGLDIGDDQFAIGEIRRADRVPHRQGGPAGQSQQQDGPDTSGTTGV